MKINKLAKIFLVTASMTMLIMVVISKPADKGKLGTEHIQSRPDPLTKPQILTTLPIEQVKDFPSDPTINASHIGIYVPEDKIVSEDERGDEGTDMDDHVSVADFLVSDRFIFIYDMAKPSLKCYNFQGELVWSNKQARLKDKLLGAFGSYHYTRSTETPSTLRAFHRGQEIPGFQDQIMSALQRSLGSPPSLHLVWWLGVDPSGKIRCLVQQNGKTYLCAVSANSAQASLCVELNPASSLESRDANFLDNPFTHQLYRTRIMERGPTVNVNHHDFDGTLMTTTRARGISVYQLQQFNLQGNLERTVRLPSGELSAIEETFQGSALTQVDQRGHFYRLSQSQSVRSIELSPWIAVTAYYAVLEYDVQGHFVGIRAVFDRGPDRSQGYCVDADGNVYYLQFHKTHLAVMKAQRPL